MIICFYFFICRFSNIQCDDFDTDISTCRSDGQSELENSCRHVDDVGLRCYPRTWAGIRLGVTAKESHIKGVTIEKAGLLDYSTKAFKPGVKNRLRFLKWLIKTENVQ